MRWAGNVARIRENVCIYKGLAVGRSEGMKQFARSALKWEDRVKIYIKNKMRRAHRIDVAQDRSQWLVVVVVVFLYCV
jgi:hypothetical protein